jgi:rubredoxin
MVISNFKCPVCNYEYEETTERIPPENQKFYGNVTYKSKVTKGDDPYINITIPVNDGYIYLRSCPKCKVVLLGE